MFAGDKKTGGVLLHGQYIPSFLQRTSSHPTPPLQRGVETANHISSINCLDKTPNLPKLTNSINSQTHELNNLATQKLKILSFILQYHSYFRSVLAKI